MRENENPAKNNFRLQHSINIVVNRLQKAVLEVKENTNILLKKGKIAAIQAYQIHER